MSFIDQLFWEKYRPKNFKQLILLPRISSFFNDGLKLNVILYGTSGTGKSTLARLLSENHNSIEINASLQNSVELLREEVLDHCQTLSFRHDKNAMKVVFLDEFDRASAELQDALKAFMEKYDDKVRFILTTNHINKINGELKSRFNEVNFDPINQQEREYLKKHYLIYLKAVCKKENVEDLLNREDILNDLINKHFPDLRKTIQIVQEFVISKYDFSIFNNSALSNQLDFYEWLLNKENNVIDNYNYVMVNFLDSFDDAFKFLGRSFFSYLLEKDQSIIEKIGPNLVKLSKEYNETYNNTIDPILHLISYISDIKNILNKL